MVFESTGHAHPATNLGYVVQEGDTPPPRDSINIPGPLLVLRREEPVRITVVNNLDEPTGVHWHGLEIESFPGRDGGLRAHAQGARGTSTRDQDDGPRMDDSSTGPR